MTGYDDFKEEPTADGLTRLAKLAAELNSATHALNLLNDEVRKASDVVKDFAERQIPDLMDELGIADFKTTEGLKIVIKKTIRASIPPAMKQAAMTWLDENGHGGLIKRTVVVNFTRADEEKAKKLLTTLQPEFENVMGDRKVESSTLRAFITERLAQGEEIPLALFGAWEQRIAKVTS